MENIGKRENKMEKKQWPVKIPDFDYAGKTVVITGSTKGIGKAIAFAYARCHASVVITGRKQEECNAVAEEIRNLGGIALGVRADVQNINEIHWLADQAEQKFGHIDIWVNCAGVAITKKILQVTEEDYEKVMDTNLKSVYFGSQTAAERMSADHRGGKIIQIASVGGLKGSNGLSLYGASKAAVINLTKTMAMEWSRYGIQVNAICPGYVETEINKEVFANEKFREKVLHEIPQRRLGTVDEIASIALFLGSNLSNMINGEAIVADMGAICG